MKLSGVHFLLTYKCGFTCDHCFLYCSPSAKGVFTLKQINMVLDEAVKLKTVNDVYFEGGEPFLYYPLLIEGVKVAQNRGFTTGIVTNAYWATTFEDALIWLKPLQEAGISYIGLSDDSFHYGDAVDTPPKNANKAAQHLGINAGFACIEPPVVKTQAETSDNKGEPVVSGGAMLKGRAADQLVDGLPTQNIVNFSKCTHEELKNPGRVHVDPFGNVMVCQGLSIGNLYETPLSVLIQNYKAEKHPVCGPLLKGGPKCLAETYHLDHAMEYASDCHFCYSMRKKLLTDFPKYLAPAQVYGVEVNN